jgi:hypothetical protein
VDKILIVWADGHKEHVAAPLFDPLAEERIEYCGHVLVRCMDSQEGEYFYKEIIDEHSDSGD